MRAAHRCGVAARLHHIADEGVAGGEQAFALRWIPHLGQVAMTS